MSSLRLICVKDSTQKEPHPHDSEIDIVKAIARGKTTKEIAEERFSSVHTITTHRKNIFRKLGINTAHEVIKRDRRDGSGEHFLR